MGMAHQANMLIEYIMERPPKKHHMHLLMGLMHKILNLKHPLTSINSFLVANRQGKDEFCSFATPFGLPPWAR